MANLILFLLLIFHADVSSSGNCPSRQSIEQSLEDAHVPGAAIIVVNATHSLYEQVFGYHSLTSKRPIDIEKSIFSLASVSKTFIGIAIMQLVQQELVDLDADINRYLLEPSKLIFNPYYPSHTITLRRLLSHSASIAVDREVLNKYYQPDDIAFFESVADACYKYFDSSTSHWLPKAPGTVMLYSNEGATLAALVVECVTNMSYIDYVETKIFKPLDIDIDRTGTRLADFSHREDLVEHYAYASDESDLEVWKEKLPTFNITHLSVNLY